MSEKGPSLTIDTGESSEYNEQNEMKKKKLPRIYDLEKDRKLVIKNDKVELYDLHLRESDSEKIIWTYAIGILQPYNEAESSQLRPWTPFEAHVKYTVLEGIGKICISEFTKPIRKGKVYVVEKNIRHNVENAREDMRLIFTMDYAGYVDLRDLYKPVEQQVKKSKESMESVFGFKKEELREKVRNV